VYSRVFGFAKLIVDSLSDLDLFREILRFATNFQLLSKGSLATNVLLNKLVD
jgi:hypothetical protein